jgi:hypothetical protein
MLDWHCYPKPDWDFDWQRYPMLDWRCYPKPDWDFDWNSLSGLIAAYPKVLMSGPMSCRQR